MLTIKSKIDHHSEKSCVYCKNTTIKDNRNIYCYYYVGLSQNGTQWQLIRCLFFYDW